MMDDKSDDRCRTVARAMKKINPLIKRFHWSRAHRCDPRDLLCFILYARDSLPARVCDAILFIPLLLLPWNDYHRPFRIYIKIGDLLSYDTIKDTVDRKSMPRPVYMYIHIYTAAREFIRAILEVFARGVILKHDTARIFLRLPAVSIGIAFLYAAVPKMYNCTMSIREQRRAGSCAGCTWTIP